MRLSHSAREKYVLCPRKYKHHYIDKLRGTAIPSPLFFGGALDEAFSHLLVQKKHNLTELELSLQLTETPETLFEKKMLHVESNKQVVLMPQNPDADYFSSDFAPELIGQTQLEQLQSLEPAYSLANFIDFHQQCKEQFKAKRSLPADDKILYNYMTWISLVEKGKLMIDAYKTDIMPQIAEVFDIQKAISIKNADGDEISGLIDFTCSFNEEPQRKYVMDNKSSSTPYEASSVAESEQLSTYCEAEKIPDAGYAVIQKKLFKRAPVIRTQLILDTIPEETYEKTFDNFMKTCYSIESGKFEQNWDSCYAFGRRCEYFKLCKHGSMSGLVKVGK